MEGCCSSMETRTNKRDKWRGKEDKSPISLCCLEALGEWHRAYREVPCLTATCDWKGTTQNRREGFSEGHFNVLHHWEFAKQIHKNISDFHLHKMSQTTAHVAPHMSTIKWKHWITTHKANELSKLWLFHSFKLKNSKAVLILTEKWGVKWQLVLYT